MEPIHCTMWNMVSPKRPQCRLSVEKKSLSEEAIILQTSFYRLLQSPPSEITLNPFALGSCRRFCACLRMECVSHKCRRMLFSTVFISLNINNWLGWICGGGADWVIEEKKNVKRNLEEHFKGAISSESLFFCGPLKARNRRTMKRATPQWGFI